MHTTHSLAGLEPSCMRQLIVAEMPRMLGLVQTNDSQIGVVGKFLMERWEEQDLQFDASECIYRRRVRKATLPSSQTNALAATSAPRHFNGCVRSKQHSTLGAERART